MASRTKRGPMNSSRFIEEEMVTILRGPTSGRLRTRSLENGRYEYLPEPEPKRLNRPLNTRPGLGVARIRSAPTGAGLLARINVVKSVVREGFLFLPV